MTGVRGFKVLLIAGSLLGSSLTLAAAADTDRAMSVKAPPQIAADKSPLVRSVRKPKAVVRAVRRSPDRPVVFWPYRPYEKVAVNWPLFLIGTGFGY